MGGRPDDCRQAARTRFLSGLLYVGPLILWLAVIFGFSTSAGGTARTMTLVDRLLLRLAPELYASLTPYHLEWADYLVRKCAHFVEYFVLLLLAVRALQRGRAGLRWSALASALALSMAYACTDEFHQRFVQGRSPMLRDVILDWSGALAAALVTLMFFGAKAVERRAEPEAPRQDVPHASAHAGGTEQ